MLGIVKCLDNCHKNGKGRGKKLTRRGVSLEKTLIVKNQPLPFQKHQQPTLKIPHKL